MKGCRELCKLTRHLRRQRLRAHDTKETEALMLHQVCLPLLMQLWATSQLAMRQSHRTLEVRQLVAVTATGNSWHPCLAEETQAAPGFPDRNGRQPDGACGP